jgi:hypothetical protein
MADNRLIDLWQQYKSGMGEVVDPRSFALNELPQSGTSQGLAGALQDAEMYYTDPESRRWYNYLLSAAGALPSVPSLKEINRALENLSIGMGYGIQNQMEGLYQMAAHPVQTGKGMAQLGQAVYKNPGLLGDLLKSEYQRGTSGLLGFGEVLGENLSPGMFRRNPRNLLDLTTYHGSPHRINNVTPDAPYGKFDLSKIGTGEGAQAYGHGIYLAETPDVAKNYASAKGHLYTVDLPDEHIAKMLDWDAPLSEQPDIVQRAAAELGMSGDNITGKDVYGRAGTNWMLKQPDLGSGVYVGRDKAASEYFRALGIPGIRYLDNGSRAAGEGTRNFVIFDPEVVKILSRE